MNVVSPSVQSTGFSSSFRAYVTLADIAAISSSLLGYETIISEVHVGSINVIISCTRSLEILFRGREIIVKKTYTGNEQRGSNKDTKFVVYLSLWNFSNRIVSKFY